MGTKIETPDRAKRAILDAAAYLDREPTSNLADFASFVETSARASSYFVGRTGKLRTDLGVRDVARLVGLYSRYQDAKRSNVLAEILSPAKAPAKRAPAKPKPAPVAPVAPVE